MWGDTDGARVVDVRPAASFGPGLFLLEEYNPARPPTATLVRPPRVAGSVPGPRKTRTDRPPRDVRRPAPQRRWWRGTRAAAALVGALAATLNALVSLSAFHGLRLGEDLALFTQALKGYAQGQAPLAPAKGDGFNLLGDHFHPVVAVLAPAYRLWPDPRVLLLAQAILVGVATALLTAAALRHLPRKAAVALGTAFALGWPLQSLAVVGFHEIAFALPLLAGSLAAVLDGRHRTAVLWALPLLLVKEDQALTVAVLGVVLALRGSRRLGLAVAAAGVGGFVLITGVVIPAIGYYGRYTYWSAGTGEGGSAVGGVLAHLGAALSSPLPWTTALLLLLTVLGTCLGSPLMLLTLPAVGVRLVSDNQAMWTWQYHYDATLAVILLAASVDALSRRPQWRRHATGVAVAVLAVAVLMIPGRPLDAALRGTLGACPTCAAAEHVLAQVPDGADVAVDAYLTPRAAGRTTTRILLPGIADSGGHPLTSNYAVLDSRRPESLAPGGVRDQLLARGFVPIAEDAPYELFRRR